MKRPAWADNGRSRNRHASPFAFVGERAHALRLSDLRTDASAPRLRQAGSRNEFIPPMSTSLCALAGAILRGAE